MWWLVKPIEITRPGKSGGAQVPMEHGISACGESEAVRASNRVAAGGPVDFALSAVPAGGLARSPADWKKDEPFHWISTPG
jgi:hypothetical protein